MGAKPRVRMGQGLPPNSCRGDQWSPVLFGDRRSYPSRVILEQAHPSRSFASLKDDGEGWAPRRISRGELGWRVSFRATGDRPLYNKVNLVDAKKWYNRDKHCGLVSPLPTYKVRSVPVGYDHGLKYKS